MALSHDQQKLKQALIDSGEEWSSTWENILTLDPHYFEAYLGLRRVPRDKKALSVKVQELVLLSIDASCTHLFEPGVRAHTSAALKAGATKEEIMETLELSSVLGVHSVNVGIPLLNQVLEESGKKSASSQELNERQESLKAEFTKRRGYWSQSWPPVLKLSPDFFEAYMNFSSVPFSEGHRALDAKTKELIYCAIDCATTHLYQPGLKIHIQNAINHGASEQEVMEVFELAALMGVHTVMMGADVLTRELGKGVGKV